MPYDQGHRPTTVYTPAAPDDDDCRMDVHPKVGTGADGSRDYGRELVDACRAIRDAASRLWVSSTDVNVVALAHATHALGGGVLAVADALCTGARNVWEIRLRLGAAVLSPTLWGALLCTPRGVPCFLRAVCDLAHESPESWIWSGSEFWVPLLDAFRTEFVDPEILALRSGCQYNVSTLRWLLYRDRDKDTYVPSGRYKEFVVYVVVEALASLPRWRWTLEHKSASVEAQTLGALLALAHTPDEICALVTSRILSSSPCEARERCATFMSPFSFFPTSTPDDSLGLGLVLPMVLPLSKCMTHRPGDAIASVLALARDVPIPPALT